MTEKCRLISEDIVERVIKFEGIEAVTLTGDTDLPSNDPYFYLSFDVYYSGQVPAPAIRRSSFIDAGAFESSHYAKKDRFLLQDLPIRIEYKAVDRIDQILSWGEENLWTFRQNGTYMFFRLQEATILFERSEWLSQTREKLNRIPERFWTLLEQSCMATMEHYLNDLESAVLKDDRLFYTISAGGFIKYLCSMLYIVNRTFEPSGRQLHDEIMNLEMIPENFKGRFESFISEDNELPGTRKMEIASLMARSVIRMVR